MPNASAQDPQAILHDQYETLRQCYAAARLDVVLVQVAGVIATPRLHLPGTSAVAQIGEIAVFFVSNSERLQFARIDGNGNAGFSSQSLSLAFRDTTPAGELDSFARQCWEWLERPEVRYVPTSEMEDAYLTALIQQAGDEYAATRAKADGVDVKASHASLYRAYSRAMVNVMTLISGRFIRRPATANRFEFELCKGTGLEALTFQFPDELHSRAWRDAQSLPPHRLLALTRAAESAAGRTFVAIDGGLPEMRPFN